MATIANCISPTELTSVDRVPLPISQRFPVPNQALGFCAIVGDAIAIPVSGPTYYFAGVVVSPESNYLEPTTGQIWPR
jgi:hypothetical protein